MALVDTSPDTPRDPLPLINPRYSLPVKVAGAALGVAALACALPAAVPQTEAARIAGMTVLTGAAYGFANDLIACSDCPEYFTAGHMYDGQNLRYRVVNTLHPFWNALVWGALATWHVCAVAGAALGLLAQVPVRGTERVSAKQIAPVLAGGALATLGIAHVASRVAQKRMEARPGYCRYCVPQEYQAKWEGCNMRNMTGYAALGLGGAGLGVGVVAARLGLLRKR